MTSRTVSARDVRIISKFWSARQEIARTQGITYQLEALEDRVPEAAASHALRNFRIAAGIETGEHYGYPFQDSDAAKWLEAVAYSLMWHPDPELENKADEIIALIGKAQQEDGYFCTYHIIKDPEKRFTNLMDDHELYVTGHMTEAAVAYYQATGKRALLDIVTRMIECVANAIGPEDGKIHGYPGHPALEMALMRLYELTGEDKFLSLAKYFIDERGRHPLFFQAECEEYGNVPRWNGGKMGFHYFQAHLPVREQTEAVGHAVRAAYLYSGMADVARETGDDSLVEACRRLWNSITRRRMYITGAIGSHDYGEAFTYDYDLPNDSAYAETCASVAMVFFAQRMLRIEPKSEYADIMEWTLYNSVLSGMDLDGRKFFYVNPLEVVPEACEKIKTLSHVEPVRQAWFGCACCPPNLMRLLTSLGEYIYTVTDDTAYVHLYIGSRADLNVGGKVRLEMESEMPWEGKSAVSVYLPEPRMFRIALRVPAWSPRCVFAVNGKEIDPQIENGYAIICREWNDGDRIECEFDMPVTIMRADPRIRADRDMIAVTRGPIVYCGEEADNGSELHLIHIDLKSGFRTADVESPDKMTAIYCKAFREKQIETDLLYSPYKEPEYEAMELKMIPYYAWANRGKGEMRVYFPHM